MKRLLSIAGTCVLMILPTAFGVAQSRDKVATPTDIPTNLKKYYVVFINKGDKFTNEHTPEAAELMRGHLAYIRLQTEKGVFVLTGPFTDNSRVLGLIVVNAISAAEATTVMGEDPEVKAGILTFELHPAIFSEFNSTAKY